MAQDYNINYEDERFQQVEADKNAAMSELEQTYGGMIGEADKYYQAQIDASKQWADKQSQLQQEQTDFTIEQIEQQKQQAQKDYTKEQSGAYVDWQKQSNQYGTEAERMASAGMMGTGFSESSRVGMYNAYQNRVATARESYSQAVLNYNNAIKDARLQNNSVLAEIAYQALQSQLELSLQGFQYKNNLILEQANKKVEMDNQYYNRYMDVLNQINHENAMAEEIRQYEQNYQLQVKQLDESIRQFNQNYDLKKQEFAESIRQFNEEIARLKKKDDEEAKRAAEELALKKKQVEQAQKQWEAEMAIQREQLAIQKAQASKSKSNGSNASSAKKQKAPVVAAVDKKAAGLIDQSTVAALGKGPLSDSGLADLVASGQVDSYLKNNGQLGFTSNANAKTNAGQYALDKYTVGTSAWKNRTKGLSR